MSELGNTFGNSGPIKLERSSSELDKGSDHHTASLPASSNSFYLDQSNYKDLQISEVKTYFSEMC